jgi:hypothetical protein
MATTNFILPSATDFPFSMWIESPPLPFAFQGCSAGAFKVYMYSPFARSYRIDLYSQGSRSIPWQIPQNKWSHLNPQWRFTDSNNNVIDHITISDMTEVTFNSTSGYLISGEFNYIDDMPSYKEQCILLWATVDLSDMPVYLDKNVNSMPGSSFINSKILTVVPYYINQLTPTYWGVTRDGINPLFNFYWDNTPITHIITLMGTTSTASCTSMMANIPLTNAIGLSSNGITKQITNLPTSAITWIPGNSGLYLSAFDSQDFNIGGYLKGTVKSTDIGNNIIIQVSGDAYYEYIPLHYPFLWISNPENNNLNRVLIPQFPSSWRTTDVGLISSTLAQEKIFDVSYLQLTGLTDIMALTGFHGIYGIAVDGEKNIWCTDAETDKVYKFDMNCVLLSTIDFTTDIFGIGTSGGCTPAGIAIDGNNGVWITFHDSVSTIYMDKDGNYITSYVPSISPETPYTDPEYKPIAVETSKDNSVWITYGNTYRGALVNFDTNAGVLTTINLPLCSNPMDVCLAGDNGVWISLSKHSGPPYGISEVRKYSTDPYILLSSIPALNPSYLAVDAFENLWFTESGNTLTKVSTAGVLTHWTVGAAVQDMYSPESGIPLGIYSENALEGLCCDIWGKVWVLNSIDNTLYTIDDNIVTYAGKLNFDNNTSWYNDGGYIHTDTNIYTKSIQAFGDFNGYKWMKKYENLENRFLYVSLSGESNPFNIYDFGGFDIRRFNENWNASDTMKGFNKSSHIMDNPVFWDRYMKSVWGDSASEQGKSFGREAYEKISNFVSNHSDINTCNIDQLYSLANMTDVPIDDYGITYPQDLKRIMDIGSINQQVLWGSRCKCNRNITNEYKTFLSGYDIAEYEYICDICGHYHSGNRGELFDPITYMVSAYTPFIIKEKSNNKYQLITPPPSCNNILNTNGNSDICIPLTSTTSTCLTTYALSSYYHILLPNIFNYYSLTANQNDFLETITHFCFYDYFPQYYCKEQIAGIINWDDENTTLNENISSVYEWYGEGQTLERIINYILHKGLGLIEG